MIKLNESQLEAGLNCARSSNKYDIFILVLLSILQLFLHTNTSAYPILFKQPKFLCKERNSSEIFERNCSKKEVCEKNMTKGVDFIVNENSLDSFISELDMYCYPLQISFLESAMFVGPSISILLTPFILNNLGVIKSLKICGIIYLLFMLMIFQMQSVYIVTFSFYGIFICTYTMYNCKSLYIVEMCEARKRSLFYGILNINSGLAGIFVILIIDYSNSLRIAFIFNVIAISTVILIIHFKFVESVRFTFLTSEAKLVIRDLQQLAFLNGDASKLNEWVKNIEKTATLYTELAPVDKSIPYIQMSSQNINVVRKNSLLKKINFFSILNYPSQINNLVIFTILVFIFKFSNVFLLMEVSHTKTLDNIIVFFLVDSISNLLSAIIMELPSIGRKKLLFVVMICNFVLFMIGFFWYKYNKFSLLLTILIRIFVTSGMSTCLLFNFESYPTLLRATFTSLNKFFAMFFNIFTPYFIMNSRFFLFFLISIFFILGSFLVLRLTETQGTNLREMPPELLEEIKTDDN